MYLLFQGVAQEKGLGLHLVFLVLLGSVQGWVPLVEWVLVALQVCFYCVLQPPAGWVDFYFLGLVMAVKVCSQFAQMLLHSKIFVWKDCEWMQKAVVLVDKVSAVDLTFDEFFCVFLCNCDGSDMGVISTWISDLQT